MSQKGNTFLIVLLPLCLSLLLLFSALVLTLQSWRASHQICRDRLLKVQEIINDVSDKIIKMNLRAQNLRRTRRHAEELVKNAKDPVSFGLAATNLAWVIAQQVAFRAEQTAMKQTALTRSRQLLHELKIEIQKDPVKGFNVFYSSPRIRLKTSPPFDLSPDHQREVGFSEKQTLQARWKFPALNSSWDWLIQLVPQTPILHGECASTILQKEMKWIPSLKKASF